MACCADSTATSGSRVVIDFSIDVGCRIFLEIECTIVDEVVVNITGLPNVNICICNLQRISVNPVNLTIYTNFIPKISF